MLKDYFDDHFQSSENKKFQESFLNNSITSALTLTIAANGTLGQPQMAYADFDPMIAAIEKNIGNLVTENSKDEPKIDNSKYVA